MQNHSICYHKIPRLSCAQVIPDHESSAATATADQFLEGPRGRSNNNNVPEREPAGSHVKPRHANICSGYGSNRHFFLSFSRLITRAGLAMITRNNCALFIMRKRAVATAVGFARGTVHRNNSTNVHRRGALQPAVRFRHTSDDARGRARIGAQQPGTRQEA